MAEVNTSTQSGRKRGIHRIPTKIDMTPMVDLAFLLITFFMLTTTFSKPKAMELNMPDKGNTTKVPSSRTTTIVLGKQDKVYYYTGVDNVQIEQTDYTATGIRRVIMEKLRTVPDGPIFVIKAMDDSRYQNMVDILDEMAITGAPIYSMVDISPADISLINQYREAHNLPD